MTKDWKKIAKANGLAIPDADLDRIAPALDSLEAVFRTQAQDLTGKDEPAVIFRASTEESQ